MGKMARDKNEQEVTREFKENEMHNDKNGIFWIRNYGRPMDRSVMFYLKKVKSKQNEV